MMLPIFFDVDVTECTDTFEFGRDGKPTYIAGPYESEIQQMEILNTLTKLGGTNFTYSAALTAEQVGRLSTMGDYNFLDDDDDDFDDELENDDDSNANSTIDSTATVIEAQVKP